MEKVMSDLVSRICSLPRDFSISRNKSIIQLLKEAGYFGHEDSVTKDNIMEFLVSNPGLIEDWETYSLNKRTSTGWYLLHNKLYWTVGFFNVGGKEKEEHFSSGLAACAIFIVNELAELAKSTG